MYIWHFVSKLKKMKKIFFIILVFPFLFSFCSNKQDLEKERQDLLETDKTFSERSEEVGNHQAFLEYAAPEAVLLKRNYSPIVGRREIREHFSNQSDSSYTLTWKPSYAKIAESGDMGYTYGVYTLTAKDAEKKKYYGTYVTIWEKNKKGNWRFLLDSGNSGIQNQDKKEN
jgi:ketosteroid isomerase-like protein